MSTEAALQLIATLPPDQAEAVLLRVVGGLDVDRVAAIMGKRPGHVRVLSHRGLKRLAVLVQDPAGSGHVVTQRNHPTVGRV
jgi:RNA polymerase sigma-70 factor (ECF subfamily)